MHLYYVRHAKNSKFYKFTSHYSQVYFVFQASEFGIDRRIVYANGKYRSGWMCTGVTRGFAGVKLSGSLKMYGSLVTYLLHEAETFLRS